MKSRQELIDYLRLTIELVTFSRVIATNIKPTDRLIADLSLDSLDYAATMLACEQWSEIAIKEDEVRWGEVDTVEKLADLFLKHSPL